MATRRSRARPRVFLLSPANCSGRRAQLMLSPRAGFDLARQLQSRDGAPLGDVFSFVSGLYFRGKLAYARRFARPPDPLDPIAGGGVLVITPNAGLRAADTRVTVPSLQGFAAADVDAGNPRYRKPLEDAARVLLDAVGSACEVVLLGSVASAKYVDVLLPIFERRLVFPARFVGRGDMSRGGLMLRCVASGLELDYVPIEGAVRHGTRPPRLQPLTRPAYEREVRLTHLRKPFWPERGITKGALLRYYADVSAVLLPHIRDRAMVMKRYPNGAAGPFFFMKRAPVPRPDWIRTHAVAHGSGTRRS